MYIWELPDWPHFRWNAELLLNPLATARLKQGRLLGRMGRLGFDLQLEAEVQAITEEALKSSEIEGEILNRETVRSSVARRLGVPDAAIAPEDRRVEGIHGLGCSPQPLQQVSANRPVRLIGGDIVRVNPV